MPAPTPPLGLVWFLSADGFFVAAKPEIEPPGEDLVDDGVRIIMTSDAPDGDDECG
jgi:hypothetical protein